MRICFTVILMLTVLLSNTLAEIERFATIKIPSTLERNSLLKPYTLKKVTSREEGLEIKGEIPYLQNLDSFGDVLNERIDGTYRQKVSSAKESKARSITFSLWQDGHYSYKGISSLLLRTSITTAVSKDEISSFNFKPDEARLIGVNDILGPNGLVIAGKVISQNIRANSERYYTNFSGLQDSDAFYASDDGNIIVFLFDAFQIAPGSEGIIAFPLKIDGVINTKPIKKDEGYWIKNTSYSLKMVSLRAVCDELGYEISWNENSKVITIERGGDVTVSLKTGINTYMSRRAGARQDQRRSLESAPVMKDNVTYVPISFFDQILELVAYHVDENENIIFSTYAEN